MPGAGGLSKGYGVVCVTSAIAARPATRSPKHSVRVSDPMVALLHPALRRPEGVRMRGAGLRSGRARLAQQPRHAKRLLLRPVEIVMAPRDDPLRVETAARLDVRHH